ncbi:MAG: rhomboid family intramembrane serine protease [Phycisphaerales bacterium]|nr:rhomboid family intramembrane serine protease [Phycisphaerales bacterium]
MGIYDRDYVRSKPQRTGASAMLGHPGLRSMSMVTMLIIINVAVFAIDGMLGKFETTPVRAGLPQVQVDPGQQALEARAPKAPAGQVYPRGTTIAAPIVIKGTNQQVGTQVVRYYDPIEARGLFSTYTAFMRLEVWRFITFQFLHEHGRIDHLLFNMIGLFFFGPIVEQALRTRKRFLAFYLTCGIFGAFSYLLLNLVGFLNAGPYTSLIGASAGVFGVLIASAFVARDATMLFMGFVPMRVSTGAYLMTGLAAFNLLRGGMNAGGDAAHIGGALAGFIFIRNIHWLEDFFDIFGPPRAKSPKAKRAKRVRGGPSAQEEAREDALLAKVANEGMHSLTDEERAFLDMRSRQKRGG